MLNICSRLLEYLYLLNPAELDRLCVVLVASRNPLNIGAAARAMSNFGFAHLRVVRPYDPAFREARSAVGASAIISAAKECPSVADAVADCRLVVGTTAVRRRALQHSLKRLEHGARLIRKQLKSARVALLFGSEKFGLSNDDLSHCHWLMRIPACEESISMNLGQAVAVCLYELIRESLNSQSKTEKQKLAAAKDFERITGLLTQALQESGYLDRRRVADAGQRIRRLVRRLQILERDSGLWLGMLRQILWKLQTHESANDR